MRELKPRIPASSVAVGAAIVGALLIQVIGRLGSRSDVLVTSDYAWTWPYEAALWSSKALFVIPTFAMLGFACGRLNPGNPIRWGLASMAALPLLIFAEFLHAPTAHNMWPFELLFMGYPALSAAVGALGGWYFASLKKVPSELRA